jgi:hypothetical protein
MFGENSTKAICLWLKDLPKLTATNIITPTKHISKSGLVYDEWWFNTCLISDLKKRASVRSKTFPGIAKAMAEQWTEVKSGCDANDDGIPPNNKLLGILPTIL